MLCQAGKSGISGHLTTTRHKIRWRIRRVGRSRRLFISFGVALGVLCIDLEAPANRPRRHARGCIDGPAPAEGGEVGVAPCPETFARRDGIHWRMTVSSFAWRRVVDTLPQESTCRICQYECKVRAQGPASKQLLTLQTALWMTFGSGRRLACFVQMCKSVTSAGNRRAVSTSGAGTSYCRGT